MSIFERSRISITPAGVHDLVAAGHAVLVQSGAGEGSRVPDDEFGQRLRAFVVRRDGSTVDGEGIKEHVRANLARFKVPRDVVFLDALPRNATGKVGRAELSTSD